MATPLLSLNEKQTRALDYVANQELKGLSYVALDDIGIGTRNEVVEAIDAQTGEKTLHYVKTYPDTYRKYGFADTVQDIGRNGRPATYFMATEQGLVLPVVGATLAWSLEHPHHALNDVLSTSSSKGSAAPANSVQIFDGLLRGMSIGEMDLPGYVRTEQGWSTAHSSRLKTLVRRGFVDIVEDENRFRILSPEYRGSRQFNSLRPATQVAYKILAIAKDLQPERQWTTSELVSLAREHQLIQPEDEQELDDIVDRFASTATPKYGPGAIEKIDFVKRIYRLNPVYADVIQSLVDTVASLQYGDESTQAKHADTARDLYLDQQAAKELTVKAMANSPRGNVN